jgi:SAM-dependent methyltransferase
MYLCPDCKTQLVELKCPSCGRQFDRKDGFPILFSRDPRFQSGASIGTTYDDIYSHRVGVWEDQGRTPEFIAFFSDLLSKYSDGRILEVGCGEGFLLSAIRAREKYAIDLSIEALRKASGRSQAKFCVALAERLPFANEYFDLLVSVGVMEHFLDDREATKEIFRVLAHGGHYVVLIHVHLSMWESISQKTREYLYPRLRPFALIKWISTKFIRPISQPIQHPYTRDSVKACLEECGFVVEEIVSTKTHADAPLIGPHVLTYIACKQ